MSVYLGKDTPWRKIKYSPENLTAKSELKYWLLESSFQQGTIISVPSFPLCRLNWHYKPKNALESLCCFLWGSPIELWIHCWCFTTDNPIFCQVNGMWNLLARNIISALLYVLGPFSEPFLSLDYFPGTWGRGHSCWEKHTLQNLITQKKLETYVCLVPRSYHVWCEEELMNSCF